MTGTVITIAVLALLSLVCLALLIAEIRWWLFTRFTFWLEERRQHR